jgi:hypothetical protein
VYLPRTGAVASHVVVGLITLLLSGCPGSPPAGTEDETGQTSTDASAEVNVAQPPPGPATAPAPAHEATDVAIDTGLTWAATARAISYGVYFGTHNPPSHVADTSVNAWAPERLEYGTTYYWQIAPQNEGGSTPSDVWSFTTQLAVPDIPTTPNPPDGADTVSIDTDLDWADAANATSYDVFFGTTNPPPLVGTTTTSELPLGAIEPGRTYFWRVSARNNTGSATGPVWSFTTQAPSDAPPEPPPPDYGPPPPDEPPPGDDVSPPDDGPPPPDVSGPDSA